MPVVSDSRPPTTHAVLGLNDVVHQRVRLGILCVLYEIEKAEFTYLRQLLELSDGNLARHLGVLGDAGLVVLTKQQQGSRPRTWVALTSAGKRAFRDEVDRLDRIVRAHRQSPIAEEKDPT
jgi:DNA-binding PadR family transcriptional regulator